jgi:hypothetical protein
MGIRFNEADTAMTADCGTAATRAESGKWEASWLPGREFGRNAAITAMILAEDLAAGLPANHKGWLFIDGWSGELGLTRNQALELFRQAQKSPEPEPGA